MVSLSVPLNRISQVEVNHILCLDPVDQSLLEPVVPHHVDQELYKAAEGQHDVEDHDQDAEPEENVHIIKRFSWDLE